MDLISTVLLICVLVVQVVVFTLSTDKSTKLLPFLTISLYSIKPVFEKVLPMFDILLQFSIIILFLIDLLYKYKSGIKFKYESYMMLFGLLIITNGLYNALFNNSDNFSSLYTQGFLNYAFILITCIYLLNSIKFRKDFENILRNTRFNIIFLFLLSVYDVTILGLNRAGEVVNPNYLSQMTIILLLFYIFSAEKKYSFISIIYYLMSIITVLLTGSNSGLMGLSIIAMSIILYIFKLKNLINFIYYAFWALTSFYMWIIIYTSNYTYGLLKYFVKEDDTSRIDIWRFSFNEFLQQPLMGDFYNSFLAPWQGFYFVTHNDYLRLLVELGVFGLLILFLFTRKQLLKLLMFQTFDALFLFTLMLITMSYSLSHNNINNLMFWLVLLLPTFKIFKLDKAKLEEDSNESVS